MKDYYKILGVEKGASADDIKKAYRKLAHQHHPDKAGGDEAKFKEINEAYQVLSDAEKRKRYDQFGTADGFPGFGGGSGPFGGFDVRFEGQNFGDFGDLGDIFETFFGGGTRARRKTYQRGSDVEFGVEISLEEAFHGTAKKISFSVPVKCTTCSGKGGEASAGMATCTTCDGKGEIREQRNTFFGAFAQVKQCSACAGTGSIPKKMCATCKGTGRVRGERTVEVELLPGIHADQIIKVAHMGEAGERGSQEGDLYVRVKIKAHRTFERHGDDLVVRHELNLVDLLIGKKIDISTVSGGKVSVEVPAHFNLREPLRIPGEGMPRFGSFGRGDLLVDFSIKAPKKFSGKAKKLLEELEGEL